MEPKIEKGIPIPFARETSRTSFLRTLELGDSFQVNDEKLAEDYRQSMLKLKMKPVVRKNGEGFRIWKTT